MTTVGEGRRPIDRGNMLQVISFKPFACPYCYRVPNIRTLHFRRSSVFLCLGSCDHYVRLLLLLLLWVTVGIRCCTPLYVNVLYNTHSHTRMHTRIHTRMQAHRYIYKFAHPYIQSHTHVYVYNI